jgi:hypothetical protein
MKVKIRFYTRAVVYKEVEMTQAAYDGTKAQFQNLRGREARKLEKKMFDELVGSWEDAEFDDAVELYEFEPIPPENGTRDDA